MFTKSVQKIFDLTLSKLPLGPANHPSIQDALGFQKTIAMNELANQMLMLVVCSSIAYTFEDLFKKRVLYFLLSSLLAESIKTGACDQYANLTFLNAIFTEGMRNVEYIRVHGNPGGGHCVVIVNRAQPSDLNDPSTWGAFIMIDTWSKKIIYFESSKNLTMASLFPCLGEISSIECYGSYHKPFSPRDWLDLHNALVFLRARWRDALYTPSLQLQIHESQLKIITQKFDEYIHFLYVLSHSQEVKEEKTAIPVAIQQKRNIYSSLNLRIMMGGSSTREVLFAMLPEQQDESQGIKELKQVLDWDSKENAILTKEGVRDWKIDRDWLRQVNDINTQRIKELCESFNLDEFLFRKKLDLKSCALVIEHGSREISIPLDAKQIKEMKKMTTSVGSLIKKIETENGIVYKVSIEWLRKMNKHNSAEISAFCAKLGFDLNDFIQRIDWYNRAGTITPAKHY